jgi:carbon storage regulator
MLVVSRKKNEKILIADNIEITILELGRSRVRIGIHAPKEVVIHTHLKSSPPVPARSHLKLIRTPLDRTGT